MFISTGCVLVCYCVCLRYARRHSKNGCCTLLN